MQTQTVPMEARRRARRCKLGVNKNTGRCLKTRRSKR
jgi:hypothetical protein